MEEGMIVPLLPEEEDGDLITLDPRPNTLCLVLREARVERFVKFISASAPEDRFDINALYTIEPNDEEEEEADGGRTGAVHGGEESEESDDDDLGETMMKALEARAPAAKKRRVGE